MVAGRGGGRASPTFDGEADDAVPG
jgi:hypothetical protein